MTDTFNHGRPTVNSLEGRAMQGQHLALEPPLEQHRSPNDNSAAPLWAKMCVFDAPAEHKPLPKRVTKGLPNHSTTPKPSLAMQLSFLKQKEEENSVGWGSFRSEKQKTENRQHLFVKSSIWYYVLYHSLAFTLRPFLPRFSIKGIRCSQ